MKADADTHELPIPSLIVFDLDDCVWSPEMYTLSDVPVDLCLLRGDFYSNNMLPVSVCHRLQ